MSKKSSLNKDYFELVEHNSTQLFVFYLLIILSVIGVYLMLTPLIENVFKDNLMGKVMKGGEKLGYTLDQNHLFRTTNPYTNWGVDVYLETPQEARYWFNPILSLIVPSLTFGIAIAFLLSALLPTRLGYIRQKIEREIAGILDRIVKRKFDVYDLEERNKIYKTLYNADLRDLHDLEREYGLSIEELQILHNIMVWRTSSIFFRIKNINSALQLYLKLYFTVKYGNPILGLVYIGAAVLIIIIGLRGLKFIPQNEPSLVIFALGLEFSLLILFAFTIIYGKQEEEYDKYANNGGGGDHLSSTHSLGEGKEVEELLKVFIKQSNKKKTD